MAYVFAPAAALHDILAEAAPGMPPDYWWVTACVLGILALTATIDAFTAVVPDGLIFLGMLAVCLTQGLCGSWDIAAYNLRDGVLAGLLIWAVNFAWFCKFGHDALGMGDAKWTALAVACFGIFPACFAWGLGAVFAVGYILAARYMRYRVTQVTFAPFLLLGLVVGLYWVRFA